MLMGNIMGIVLDMYRQDQMVDKEIYDIILWVIVKV